MSKEGARRSAEALLRVNGGRAVVLRVPAPAVPGSATEELGMVAPEFNEVVLRPAVFRKSGSTATLLVAVSTLMGAAGLGGAASVEALLKTAVGVVVDDVVYTVTNVVAEEANGAAYCYALSLRAPGW